MKMGSLVQSIKATANALAVAVTVAVLSSAPGMTSQPALPRPTPGQLALLADRCVDEEAVNLMKAGLADPDPALRAVAARMVAVLGVEELLPEVRSALREETNIDATREEARALSQTGRWEDLRIAVEAADRLDALHDLVTVLVARSLGPDAIPIYPFLPRRALESEFTLARFFRYATRGEEQILNRAAREALSIKDGRALIACIDAARESRVRLHPDILEGVLENLPPVTVGEVSWSFAWSWAIGPPENGVELLERIKTYAASNSEKLGDEEALGIELLARVLGAESTSEKRWIRHLRQADETRLDHLFRAAQILHGHLRRSERRALRKRMKRTYHGHKDMVLSKREARKLSESYAQAIVENAMPTPTVILPAHPRGMLDAILDLTGCAPSQARAAVVGEISFGADGRPIVESEKTWGRPGEACLKAGSLLFRTSLQSLRFPQSGSVGKNLAIFFPNPARLACYERPEPPPDPSTVLEVPAPGRPIYLTEDVEPPRRIRKVDPTYPERMRLARADGKVILEIVVRRDGCVENIEVLRSGGYLFDMDAIWAVLQWHYEPARLRGSPVKVFMTVVVDFKVR
jgi:TonB family protein